MQHTRQENEVTVRVQLRPILLTVKQFCQEHPAFTQGGMRWLLFHRQQNGLERAVVKVGRRVLIDVEEFFAWINEQNPTRNPRQG